MSFLKPKLLVAWLWFFLLLSSYYVLKPLRDGTASILSQQLDVWYMATFLFIVGTMAIYTRLVATLTTLGLATVVYQFFAASLLLFLTLVGRGASLPDWCVGPFFIWVSVFNVTIVALFWSIVTDLCSKSEAKAWFGIVAGAGSLGAIAGSAFTYYAAQSLGQRGLLAAAVVMLETGYVAAWFFLRRFGTVEATSPGTTAETNTVRPNEQPDHAANGDLAPPTLWNGLLRVWRTKYLLRICGYVLFAKFAATYVYNNLQKLMEQTYASADQRTEVFAAMNAATQIGSAIVQYLVVAALIKTFGLKHVLVLPCLIMIAVFSTIFVDDSLSILIFAQVTQQIVGYGLVGPCQNLLFTVVPRRDKYVSKGFIDTFVFRFSDFLSSKSCSLLARTQFELSTLSLALIPVLVAWLFVGLRIGKEYETRNSL